MAGMRLSPLVHCTRRLPLAIPIIGTFPPILHSPTHRSVSHTLQCRMEQISLVLPFGLPPPELAQDLARALSTPALAALLARAASVRPHSHASTARCLPHESWLASEFGLSTAMPGSVAAPAFAAAAMAALGVAPDAGIWFMIHPVHIEAGRNKLVLADPRKLDLPDLDARALFNAARPYFDEIGKSLIYGDARTWFMRADDWRELDTASPDASVGLSLHQAMPTGAGALACRKLQNEVQMLWHTAAVNERRQQRSQTPINAFWVWAGAQVQPSAYPPLACAALLASDAPAWLGPLCAPCSDFTELSALTGLTHSTLVCGELIAPALASDWADWLDAMQRLELAWFAPLLAQLKAGRIGSLRLILSHRTGHLDVTATGFAQRAFWRPPSLSRLLP